MTESGGDGSLGTGLGATHNLDQVTEAGHSHHIHHHDDSDVTDHLTVDLNTGTATFSGIRRTDDVVNSAQDHDAPDGR